VLGKLYRCAQVLLFRLKLRNKGYTHYFHGSKGCRSTSCSPSVKLLTRPDTVKRVGSNPFSRELNEYTQISFAITHMFIKLFDTFTISDPIILLNTFLILSTFVNCFVMKTLRLLHFSHSHNNHDLLN